MLISNPFSLMVMANARPASDAIMASYLARQMNVRHKTDQSPVTEARLAAHRLLVWHLSTYCPIVHWCPKMNYYKSSLALCE